MPMPRRANRSREIVRAKQALDRRHSAAPPAPFLGWHTRGYLPHCDKPGLIQLVTFRLADAMPADRRHEWKPLEAIEDERERRTKLEAYLDRGYGACQLGMPEVATLVENALLFHDSDRYRLCAWVVMPNHVHVLFEQWQTPLDEVIYSWKKYTAVEANKLLRRHGRLWQKEYWDRYMRDEEHFAKAKRYVESNPLKAGLAAKAENWKWSSANPKWTWDLGSQNSDLPPSRYYHGHLVSEKWGLFLAGEVS
jgi:REP element-mobilizing transposase RayT